MKLLLCTECKDIFNLSMEQKICSCGKTKGQYIDHLNAEYEGPAVPLGFANFSFYHAVKKQPEEGFGKEFTAFVIEKQCPTFVKINQEEIRE